MIPNTSYVGRAIKVYKIKKKKNYLKHFLEFLVVKVLYREATCRLRY